MSFWGDMKKHFKINALQLSLFSSFWLSIYYKVNAFITQANIFGLIDLYYCFLFPVEIPIRVSLFCSIENSNLAP